MLALVVIQSVSCSLKSPGPVKVRPGRNEVSKNPLRRSTSPLNSGSLAGASLIRTPSVPAKLAASAVSLPLPPIADSRSHTSVRGQRPQSLISAHMPGQDVTSLPGRDHHRASERE